MIKRVSLVLTLTIIGVMPASELPAQEWGEVSDEEWAMQPPAEYPDANVIVLFDRGFMEVSIDGIAFTRHLRMKVFNQAGIEEAADVEITLDDDDKVKSLKAYTITPGGKKHKVGRKKFYTQTIGGMKAKTFSFPKVEPGSVLEYEYKIFHRRFSFLDPWPFQGEHYTVNSTFELKLHSGFTYAFVTNNVGAEDHDPTMFEDRVSEERTFTWSLDSLPPIKDEPYVGCVKDYISSLRYQLVSYKDPYQTYNFVKGWDDLGEMFTNNVLKEYIRDNRPLQPIADEIMTANPESTARARAAYDWVSREIKTRRDDQRRYMTHESLADVIKEGFGTADEKNVTLVELAKLAGLSAWPVLISTRENARFNSKVYDLQQFNHLIAYVETDSGGVYLDASTRFCPYGMLPSSCVVAGGFLVDGKRSQVVSIPDYNLTSYRMDVTDVYLEPDGSAQCSTTVHLSGYYTAAFGIMYETEEPEEFFKSHFLDRLNTAYELGEYSFEKEPGRSRCLLKLNYTLPGYCQVLDNNLLLEPLRFSYRDNPFEAESRMFSIDFDYPFTYHNVVNVYSPEDMTTAQLPEPVHLVMQGIDFIKQYQDLGNGVRIESKLEISRPVFSPGLYKHVQEMFVGMADANTAQVIISPDI